MKFFLDTAHIPDIREASDAGLCDGVTTNPSLLSKEDGDPREIVAGIAKLVDGPVSAEVISTDTDGMVREGLEWAKLASNIVVKVPMTIDGLKAIRVLSSQDIQTNCTLIFNAMQALAAAKAGATMVSPFVGRLDDIQSDGMELVGQIVQIYSHYGIRSELIVASVRGPLHALQAAQIGADILTTPWVHLKAMMRHPLTDIGLERFLADWEKIKNR
jgi:transaldolase